MIQNGEESEQIGAALSLRELSETLKLRGVDISYSALSEFVGTDDIGEQLHVGGKGNRKEFPSEAADVLAAFLPEYRTAGGRLPQAARLLRSFLSRRGGASDGALVLAAHKESPSAVEIAEALGRAQGEALRWTQDDQVFTAAEAADFLRCSVRQIRRFVRPSFRIGGSAQGDRWRKSDLLRL